MVEASSSNLDRSIQKTKPPNIQKKRDQIKSKKSKKKTNRNPKSKKYTSKEIQSPKITVINSLMSRLSGLRCNVRIKHSHVKGEAWYCEYILTSQVISCDSVYHVVEPSLVVHALKGIGAAMLSGG